MIDEKSNVYKSTRQVWYGTFIILIVVVGSLIVQPFFGDTLPEKRSPFALLMLNTVAGLGRGAMMLGILVLFLGLIKAFDNFYYRYVYFPNRKNRDSDQ